MKFFQATNTMLRDTNSFLEQQLADAEAQLAKLRTAPEAGGGAAAQTGGCAAAQPSGNTAAPPSGGAAAQLDNSAGGGVGSDTRGGGTPADVYELVEDGGSFRATYAGEPSYEAMTRKLEANFKAQVRQLHQQHCKTPAHNFPMCPECPPLVRHRSSGCSYTPALAAPHSCSSSFIHLVTLIWRAAVLQVDALREAQRRLGQGPDADYSPEVEAAAAPDQVGRSVPSIARFCYPMELVAGASLFRAVQTQATSTTAIPVDLLAKGC